MSGLAKPDFISPSISAKAQVDCQQGLSSQEHTSFNGIRALRSRTSRAVGRWRRFDKSTRAGLRRRTLTGRTGKRVFDLIIAVPATAFLLPLLGMVAVALIVLQGRPVLIAHERIGYRGRRFLCFKFRTMVANAHEVLSEHLERTPSAREEWNSTRKLKFDPRVTPFGAILRKSSVDELPQLFNVIRGDMSLVGPRPIVEDEVRNYGPSIRYYCRVRPGLTGLWQISGRSDTTYRQRIELDTEYVRFRSLPRDFLIILRTIPAVLQSRGSY